MTDPIGGARLMLGFDGKSATAQLQDLLQATGARSVILFTRNIDDAEHARDLIAAIRDLVEWPLLVAIDQEGGAVVRVTKGATVFPGNMALGECGDVTLAYRQGQVSGRELVAMGFDLNLAPVVDLLTNPQNPGIGIRSLGADRDAAVPLARALIAGHAESNVACCLKHFPGKGAASIDAHLDLPVLDLSLEEFRDPHLVIFEDLLGSAVDLAVMTTHVIVRGLDPDLPATLSPRVVRGLLRNDFGFEGLVIADDLEMGAIEKHWSIDEAAVMAAVAGHDVLPICHSHERQIAAAHGLQGALDNGRLDPDEHRAAVARIDAVAARSHAANAALPKPDHDLAREIARRSVRVFGDQRGLLPVDGAVCLLAQSPHNIVLVEDTTPGHWADNVSECFAVRGFDVAAIIELDPTSSDLTPLDRAHAHERVILLSWDAHRFEGTRAVLDHACSTLADRLIVVHLRNPSDQVFVPDTVTALTAFGYQQCQLEAIATAISA